MDADVGVIGVGTMGSMAMWQLAKRGLSVIGFEQFGIGHDRSAAGGETRVYRTAYKEGSEYVPLLKESYKKWQELEQESGSQLLEITKGLMVVKQNSTAMDNIIESVEKYNIDHDVFDYPQAKDMFPQHNFLPDDVVILDHTAGFIHAQYALYKAAELAKKNGGQIKTYTKVNEIEVNKDHVLVVANGKEYKFGKVLITTGPWLEQLMPQYKEQIEVRRLIGHWFAAKNEGQFDQGKSSIFMREAAEAGFYGFTSLDGKTVKIALASETDDAISSVANFTKDIDIDEISLVKDIVKKYLPDIYPDPLRSTAYFEGYTPDNHPIIGEVEGKSNLVVASGFSGHGFKMSPLMGEIIADALQGKKSPYYLDEFNPNRF